ncbi:MAG: glycosyltransferase family 39 protein [Anaerolineae bacterium]
MRSFQEESPVTTAARRIKYLGPFLVAVAWLTLVAVGGIGLLRTGQTGAAALRTFTFRGPLLALSIADVAALALIGALIVLARARPRDVLPAVLLTLAVVCAILLVTSGQFPAALTVLWLGIVSELVGLVLVRWLRIRADAALTSAVALPLGLGLLALVVLAIGLAGWLNVPVVVAVTLALAIAAAYLERRRLRTLGVYLWLSWRGRPPADLATTLCLAVLALFFIIGWVGALAPETGFDALQDHLELARHFAEAGRVIAIPTMAKYYWPLNAEMIYAAAYTLAGETAAKLAHFFAGVGVAFLVFALGKRLSGALMGLIAATVLYTTPLVTWEGTNTYLDLTLMLYCTAALVLVVLWREGQRNWGLVVGIGLSLGLAVGTKLTAGFFVIAILLWMLFDAFRARSYRPLLAALIAGGVAFLVALPWLARAYVLTGNPVFPFMNSVFHSPLWYPSSEFYNLADFGTGRSLRALTVLPWQMTFNTSLFMEAPNGVVGIVYLAFVPLVMLSIKPARRYGAVVFVTALFGVLVVAFTEYLRYLLPALAGLALLAALGARNAWTTARETIPRFAAIIPVVFFAFMALNIPLALRERAYDIPLGVVLGRVPRETYLAQHVKSYGAFRYIDTHLTAADRVYVVRDFADYLSNVPLEEPPYSLDANRIYKAISLDTLNAALASACPTYLLITRPEAMPPDDPSLPHTRLLLDYARQNATLVYSDESDDLYKTPPEVAHSPTCRDN